LAADKLSLKTQKKPVQKMVECRADRKTGGPETAPISKKKPSRKSLTLYLGVKREASDQGKSGRKCLRGEARRQWSFGVVKSKPIASGGRSDDPGL